MTVLKVFGQGALPDLPWEERPAGATGPLWRWSRNPVIPRDLIPTSNSIFNSAVVPFDGRYPLPLVGYYRIILPDFFQSDGAETSSLTPEKEECSS